MYLRSRYWLFCERALFMALCIFMSYIITPNQQIQAQEIPIQEVEYISYNSSALISITFTPMHNVIQVESNIIEDDIQVPTSRFSEEDIKLLERVTMSESGNQPLECQIAVAQTIINRLDSGRYGTTIYDIVYANNQYSTRNNGAPNDSVLAAVQEAIYNPPYNTNMVYFRENHYHTFAVDYEKFGVLYFSLYPEEG